MKKLLMTALLSLIRASGQEFIPYTVTTQSVPQVYLPNKRDIRVDVKFKKAAVIKRPKQLEIMGEMRKSRYVKYLEMTTAPDNADNVTGIRMIVVKRSCIDKALGIFSRLSRFMLNELKTAR